MYCVTIVEDDSILSKYLYHECTDAGLTTRFAFSGESGLEEIRANPPDLVLLDIIMPGKSGLEVLAEMRKDPNIAHIPVIVMSVSGTDDVIKQALRLGAIDYMVKSQHTAAEIVERARDFLARGKTTQTNFSPTPVV